MSYLESEIEYDDDNYCDNCSDNTNYDENSVVSKKHKTKQQQSLKKDDDGYHKIYRWVKVKRSPTFQEIKSQNYNATDVIVENVKKCFEFYTTGYTPGTRIRHAITGVHEKQYDMNNCVGNKQENRYFKVSLVSGELGQNPHSHNLYFHSPQEYEEFFGASLLDDIKQKWFAKQILLNKTLKNEKPATNVVSCVIVK